MDTVAWVYKYVLLLLEYTRRYKLSTPVLQYIVTSLFGSMHILSKLIKNWVCIDCWVNHMCRILISHVVLAYIVHYLLIRAHHIIPHQTHCLLLRKNINTCTLQRGQFFCQMAHPFSLLLIIQNAGNDASCWSVYRRICINKHTMLQPQWFCLVLPSAFPKPTFFLILPI